MAREPSESGLPGDAGDDVLRIYTTRPDTLFGATYMVVAPSTRSRAAHDADRRAAVAAYASRPRQERSGPHRSGQAEDGRVHRRYAINPVNGEPMPIWVADYVLTSYGTGAIMAVPAHDERDFEFAQQFGLDIVAVSIRARRWPRPSARHDPRPVARSTSADGTAIHSGPFDGLATAEFKQAITDWLGAEGSAARRSTTNSATGSSAGSGSGASRFRSCTNSTPPASRPVGCGRCPTE